MTIYDYSDLLKMIANINTDERSKWKVFYE